ncbi:hypothetical protein ACFLTE_12500 [Bacteroidota bacterium]
MELNEIIDWLLEGDASVRYQTKRDLLSFTCEELEIEQKKISKEGWGDTLLSKQDPAGTWGGNIYSPKWISTTYTLQLLRRIGLHPDSPRAKVGAKILLDKGYYDKDGGINYFGTLNHSETCVTGIILAIVSYFNIKDSRIDDLANFLFEQQMLDGGWNCQSFNGAKHSSFHTTLLALEGLREYEKKTPCMFGRCEESKKKAIELLLMHRLFKSDKTGNIIKTQFTRFSFPPRWYYDVMKALDYMQEVKAPKDERFQDAIDLLQKKQTKEGLWKLQSKHPGKVFFDMEEVGKPSRWNTVRALRILKWWKNQ